MSRARRRPAGRERAALGRALSRPEVEVGNPWRGADQMSKWTAYRGAPSQPRQSPMLRSSITAWLSGLRQNKRPEHLVLGVRSVGGGNAQPGDATLQHIGPVRR